MRQFLNEPKNNDNKYNCNNSKKSVHYFNCRIKEPLSFETISSESKKKTSQSQKAAREKLLSKTENFIKLEFLSTLKTA